MLDITGGIFPRIVLSTISVVVSLIDRVLVFQDTTVDITVVTIGVG